MCHTLLQYYIHCSHSTTHFYPCIIIPPLTPQLGDRNSRWEYIHPNYDPSRHKKNALEDQAVFASSEWRDHSVPLSVAHSYHRVCPACADEKLAKDKAQEQEDRRRRGTTLWREYSQNPEPDNGSREDDDEEDDALGGRGGGSSLFGATVEDSGTQRRRVAVAELSEQIFSDRRAAAVRIARNLGMQLLPTETIDQWEHRVVTELRVRGSELVADDVNGRLVRLGDDGWEVVPLQGPLRELTPGQPRARPQLQPRPRNRQAAQSAGAQTTGTNPERTTRQQGRLGPRTMARQQQVEGRLNAPAQSTAAQEARRRTRFEEATAIERRRIEEALTARSLPMLTDEEVQRRFQPWRDLMSAPPILASIQRSIPTDDAFFDAGLGARAGRLQSLEAEETQRRRAETRQRRNAVAANDTVPSQLRNAAASFERETFNNNDAMEFDGEEIGVLESDEVSSPELAAMHRDASTVLPVSTSTPVRSRRSESPSPEERRLHPSRGGTAHQLRVRVDNRLYLPTASACSQHNDAGWELHSDRPLHANAEEDTMKAFVMGLHNGTPRTYNKGTETLVSNTCEVLVYYDVCKHVEAVFIEKLDRPGNPRDIARCGCDAFGDRLLGSRKALSRQKCIECRTEDASQKHDEQFVWLEKYIRPIKMDREYRLWPFGSKCNEGVLEYR